MHLFCLITLNLFQTCTDLSYTYLILIDFDFIISHLVISGNEIKYDTPMRASASFIRIGTAKHLSTRRPMIYGGIIRTQLPFQ